MKYPCLIQRSSCTTDIQICIEDEDIGEDGEPIVVFESQLKCNYQESAKTILTADKKLVQLTGTAFFPGDIAPEVSTLGGGTAVVFGTQRRIFQGLKARNPDASVNYTKLDLI